MSHFFGIKQHGPRTFQEGNTTVNYIILEQWINTGHSHTVRCKASSTMSRSVTHGISLAELNGFESTIKSTIGVTGIASIGSDIQANTQITTTFSQTNTITDTFNCPAPGCGLTTYALYQKVRDFQFTFVTPGFFRKRTDTHNFRELTQELDLLVENDGKEPTCPCDDKDDEDKDELVSLTIGKSNVSVRVNAKKDKDGRTAFRIGSVTYAVDLFSVNDEPREIEIANWPVFPALSGIDGKRFTATVQLIKSFEEQDLLVHTNDAYVYR